MIGKGAERLGEWSADGSLVSIPHAVGRMRLAGQGQRARNTHVLGTHNPIRDVSPSLPLKTSKTLIT